MKRYSLLLLALAAIGCGSYSIKPATYRVSADHLVLVNADSGKRDTVDVLHRGDSISVQPLRTSELSGYHWVAFYKGKTATVPRNAIMPPAQYRREFEQGR